MRVTDRRRQLFALGVTLAVVASLAAQDMLAIVHLAENWSQDLRVATLTPPRPQSDRIVIIAVTEDSLAPFAYRSPLDRRFLSNLLQTLEKKGVKAIGLDVLLDQPSEPEKDMELSKTLRALSVPVVVASAGTADGLTERQIAFMASYLDGVAKGVPMLLADRIDGTVRAVRLSRQSEGPPQLGFVAAIADALGITEMGGDTLTLRFRGTPDAETPPFAVYPAHAVAQLPAAWFVDRIALVGVDLNLADRHRTPFSVAAVPGTGDIPGVLLQAHALSQILEGYDSPESPVWLNVLIIAVVAILGASIVMLGLSNAIKIIVLIVALGIIWIGGFVTFQYGGPLLPLVSPTLALILAASFTYAWRWREENAEKRFIHGVFSKYVAPAIVDHMVENPERLRLGGERREVTFVFTDVADYTTLTENTEPGLLVKIMNEYLDGTCEIILEHGGTIDKIVGDALHVMFNAPLEQPDHAERAVNCALALDVFCQAFASRQRSRMIDFGVTRIGVNTGSAVVGNFGGARRFDYTATGDAINTAARLESVNKYLGTRICVSGATVEGCHGAKFRPVADLVLKGKSESVTAFEPLQNGDASASRVDEYLAAYRRMCAGDPQAADTFRRLGARYPGDALIRFHAERLAAGESGSLIVMKEK